MKKISILILLSTFSLVLTAQDVLNSTAYFKSVLPNTNIIATGANINSNLKTFKSPWLEELSFRTETDEFDFDRQEYQLRFNFSTRAIRKAQKELYQHYHNTIFNKVEVDQFKQVELAYENWIKLYFINEKNKILSEKESILIDKIKVLEKKALSLDLNHKELFSSKGALNNLKLDLYKLSLVKAEILDAYNLSVSGFTFDDIIKPNQITEMIMLQVSQNEAFLNQEYAMKNDLINKEIRLEKAEQNKIFDFGNIRYRGPHEDILKERISIGAAVSLNRSGSRKLKIAKLELEKAELNTKKNEDSLEAENDLDLLSKKINRNILALDKYVELKTTEQRENKKLIDLLNEKSGINPILLLDLKQNNIEIELKRLDLLNDIYRDYLEYLFSSEAIYNIPFRNYLKA